MSLFFWSKAFFWENKCILTVPGKFITLFVLQTVENFVNASPTSHSCCSSCFRLKLLSRAGKWQKSSFVAVVDAKWGSRDIARRCQLIRIRFAFFNALIQVSNDFLLFRIVLTWHLLLQYSWFFRFVLLNGIR